jgi:hypothetical protein
MFVKVLIVLFENWKISQNVVKTVKISFYRRKGKDKMTTQYLLFIQSFKLFFFFFFEIDVTESTSRRHF